MVCDDRRPQQPLVYDEEPPGMASQPTVDDIIEGYKRDAGAAADIAAKLAYEKVIKGAKSQAEGHISNLHELKRIPPGLSTQALREMDQNILYWNEVLSKLNSVVFVSS